MFNATLMFVLCWSHCFVRCHTVCCWSSSTFWFGAFHCAAGIMEKYTVISQSMPYTFILGEYPWPMRKHISWECMIHSFSCRFSLFTIYYLLSPLISQSYWFPFWGVSRNWNVLVQITSKMDIYWHIDHYVIIAIYAS